MSQFNYILRDGQPMRAFDLLEWGLWFQNANDERRVATDELGDVRISTVFLGLDHGFGMGGPPVLWETMIFGGVHDEYQQRYTSLEDAQSGHAVLVEMVKRSIGC